MSNPEKKPDRLFIITGIVLLLLIFITAGFRMFSFAISKAASGFFYPYLKFATGTAGEIRDKSLLSLDRIALARQVEKLTMRNRELALRSTAAAGIMDENRILREKLSLSAPAGWKFCTGEIILRDPLNFQESFIIDRGRNDGIAEGDAVIDTTTDGRMFLVGVIRECAARTARVSSVCDPELRVSGRLASGAVGFTNSGSAVLTPGTVRFGMLPPEKGATPGEAVMTTGYERGIPEGIKIGELQLEQDYITAGRPDLSASLVPAVKSAGLRFVTVVSRQDELR